MLIVIQNVRSWCFLSDRKNYKLVKSAEILSSFADFEQGAQRAKWLFVEGKDAKRASKVYLVIFFKIT